MSKCLAFAGGLFLLFSSPVAAEEPLLLPVRKVVLYKNGMGYFEHFGQVRTQQAVEIVLPSAQLNDVLKSLTVMDVERGPVAGVTYDSATPLDRRLAELPIKVEAAQNLVEFLNKLRGTQVEVRTATGPVAGRLMGAEVRRKQVGEYTVRETIEVAVFTPQGELRTVELAVTTALRLLEKELATEVDRYLELLNSTHQRDIRRLKIHRPDSASGRLHVSYTSEAPIWKTTYRIVLDDKNKPLLQGWAIVDNTTPTDWMEVELSLVAGAPVSFVQNLSQPIYARRPVVPLPEGVQITPQMHEATLELPSGPTAVSGVVKDPSGAMIPGAGVSVHDEQGAWLKQTTTDAEGRYRLEVPPGTYRVEASKTGFKTAVYRGVAAHPGRVSALDFTLMVGAVRETVEVQAQRPELNTSAAESSRGRTERRSSVRRVPGSGSGFGGGIAPIEPSLARPLGEAIRQQAPDTAQAQALGEQFEYKLRKPVTIRRNQSALLAIIHAELEGEKVSVYEGTDGLRHPRLAVWLKNSSGLTLDAGSFTVIDSNAFAGEGLTATINPQERRLLSYALDLGVEVAANRGTEPERTQRVEIARGVMKISGKVAEKKTYVIRNNDQKPRTVVVEHPVRSGWSLVETATPAEASGRFYRFRVEVPSKATAEVAVREENLQQAAYQLSDVTPDMVAIWVRQRTVDAAIEQALRDVLAKKGEIEALRNKMAELQREQEQISDDQERIRENLGKLGKTSEEATLRLRYIRRLEQQEDRLEKIRGEHANLENTVAASRQELDTRLMKLSFDRKL